MKIFLTPILFRFRPRIFLKADFLGNKTMKWLYSDLIPRSLEIFEKLKKFGGHFIKPKNNAFNRILSA